jgi:hypothetical protein
MARQTPASIANCPSEDELLAHAAGLPDPASQSKLLLHLDVCNVCRHLLAEAARLVQAHPKKTAAVAPAPAAVAATAGPSALPLSARPTVVAGAPSSPAGSSVSTARSTLASRADIISSTPPVPLLGGASIRTFQEGELVVERYRIARFLARGGMGEVYLARDMLLDETVALKTLAFTSLDDPRAAFRFKAEARLARRVTHPNVCRILEFGVHVQALAGRPADRIPFLTMEFLAGETMAVRLGRGRMSLAQSGPLIKQVLAGLRAIHASGIVHRDFKSENVFLVPDPRGERAVVMDFGLARALDGVIASTWPQSRLIVGTLESMAPEQMEGKPPHPTMDVFGFGVFLFEVLTGRRPFANASLTRRLLEPAPRPSEVMDSLNHAWDTIVGRCLEIDPAARYASFDELTPIVEQMLDRRSTQPFWRPPHH